MQSVIRDVYVCLLKSYNVYVNSNDLKLKMFKTEWIFLFYKNKNGFQLSFLFRVKISTIYDMIKRVPKAKCFTNEVTITKKKNKTKQKYIFVKICGFLMTFKSIMKVAVSSKTYNRHIIKILNCSYNGK